MKVAVTAASGQLGAAIIESLIKEIGKENVIGIARTPANVRVEGIEVRKGDYNSKPEFDEALKGVEVVLLVSGMDAPEKRIGQHRNVINAAKDAGVRKLVYTSIIGKDGGSTFDAIVQSNRQTEEDIKNSGLEWAIGRNGLYIEPDIEHLEEYKKEGKVANCAGDGKCAYTTRGELGYAYTRLMLGDSTDSKIYNLAGELITQYELVDYMNTALGAGLVYERLTKEAYIADRVEEHGEFLGTVIAGIYAKISNGEFEVESDYEAAAGRSHISWKTYFDGLKT